MRGLGARRVRPLLFQPKRRASVMVRRSRLALAKLFGRLPLVGYQTALLLPRSGLDCLISVPPATIKMMVRRGSKSPTISRGFTTPDSAWESDGLALLDESPTFDMMKAIFVEGRHYTESNQYERMRRAVHRYLKGETESPSKEGAYWCRSLEDIDTYFTILIHAYDDIKDNGYRTQADIAEERPSDSRHIRDEIQVAISSDGTPVLHSGGTHRTWIAQHLGLPRVPVRVIAVDRTWAKRCLTVSDRSLADQIQSALDSRLR